MPCMMMSARAVRVRCVKSVPAVGIPAQDGSSREEPQLCQCPTSQAGPQVNSCRARRLQMFTAMLHWNLWNTASAEAANRVLVMELLSVRENTVESISARTPASGDDALYSACVCTPAGARYRHNRHFHHRHGSRKVFAEHGVLEGCFILLHTHHSGRGALALGVLRATRPRSRNFSPLIVRFPHGARCLQGETMTRRRSVGSSLTVLD